MDLLGTRSIEHSCPCFDIVKMFIDYFSGIQCLVLFMQQKKFAAVVAELTAFLLKDSKFFGRSFISKLVRSLNKKPHGKAKYYFISFFMLMVYTLDEFGYINWRVSSVYDQGKSNPFVKVNS